MKRGLIPAAKIAVSVGILVGIFLQVPIRDVLSALRSADPWLIAAGVALVLLTHFLAAVRMHLLTAHQGLTLTIFDIFRITSAVFFYRLGLPGGMGGGLIRWYKLSRQDRKPLETFNVMMYDRTVGALAIIGIGVFFLVVDWPFGTHPLAWAGAGVLGLGLLSQAFVYALAFGGRLSQVLGPRLLALLPAAVGPKLRRLTESADRFAGFGRALHLKVWAWSVATRLLGVSLFYLFALALDVRLSFATICWVRTVVYVLILVPVTVSGLGVREGAFLLLLTPYGVRPEQSLAFSMLSLGSMLLLAGLGGCFELADLARGRRNGPKDGLHESVPDLR
jgi:glycosyltransferase 2 family protein